MRGIHTCCPEAPSTINIVQNILQMDGDSAYFAVETFLGSEVINGTIELDYVPYAAASVQVILNTGTQVPSTDYVVLGNKVQFGFVPAADDVIHVRYFSTETGTTLVPGTGDLPTGFTMGYSGAVIPDGWYAMDGVQKVYNQALTADLYAYLGSNAHLVASSGTDDGVDFRVLKGIQSPYYVDGNLLAGNTIIKI